MRSITVCLIATLATTLVPLPLVATEMTALYEIQVTQNADAFSVNGTEVQLGNLLFYTISWDTDAPLTGGAHPNGKAHYKQNSIQAGGSLLFNGINIATNNATSAVNAKNFEVENKSGASEDKWKTESIFTDDSTSILTVASSGGPLDISNYTPEKIKIEIKVSFLSTNSLLAASDELFSNVTSAMLAALPDNKRKFELKWKGNVGGVKDPKIMGTVSNLTFAPESDPISTPEPGTLSLLGLGILGLLALRHRRC